MTVPVQIQTRNMTQSLVDTGCNICLKQIEYKIFHEQPNQGYVSSGIGTGYHAGIAEYYLDRREQGYFLPTDEQVAHYADTAAFSFLANIEFDEYTGKPNESYDWTFQAAGGRNKELILTEAEAVERVRNFIIRYFADGHPWPQEYQVIAVEQRLELPYPALPGWNRSGGIDLVLFDGVLYVLVDNKTSKKKWTKTKGTPTSPQAAWYIDLWREWSGSRDIRFVYDVMGHDGSFERRPAPRSDRHIEVTLERGRDLARLIEQGGPFPASPESFLCSKFYCDYWKVCPYGKTLNFIDEEAI
jgi:hypothetical protein